MQQLTQQQQVPIVKIEKLEKRYGKFTALHELNLDIMPGSHLLILGPNGAGKTTLIKSMMGILNYSGKITINGIDVTKDPRGAKRNIGYVPQNYAFYESLTIYDHAVLTTRLKNLGTDQIEEKLRLVNLWETRRRRVRACSDGMKQRLGIALAMIGNPKVLLLDEPTSNVDLRGQLEFQKLLRALIAQGKTMITTSHLTGLGELATEVMVIDHGRIITRGPPDELMSRLSVNDTIFIRAKGVIAENVKRLTQDLGATDIEIDGEWLRAAVPTKMKLGMLKGLLNSGIAIDDLLVERSQIESEYVKLIGAGAPGVDNVPSTPAAKRGGN
ncbi:MAG TPA: ABC transporter ATP-binding protein [Nitrososphaerales archaeon]|nr:ABC transporter ATP-binding protein [Nitrososphaerales archaeon]